MMNPNHVFSHVHLVRNRIGALNRPLQTPDRKASHTPLSMLILIPRKKKRFLPESKSSLCMHAGNRQGLRNFPVKNTTVLKNSPELADEVFARMNCPHCDNTNTLRAKRKGAMDQILSWFNKWPYHCMTCQKKFWSSQRQATRQPGPKGEAWNGRAKKPSAATIEVRAPSHMQLDEILVALNQALRECDTKFGSAKHAQGPVYDTAAVPGREKQHVRR